VGAHDGLLRDVWPVLDAAVAVRAINVHRYLVQRKATFCRMLRASAKVSHSPGANMATEKQPVTQQTLGQKFLAAFGDRGGKWFAEGKTFEEASTLFNNDLLAEREQLRKQNTELQARLSRRLGHTANRN
jgi:hypothetical protein